jgi:amidophosphoribosyltransferase
MFRERNVEPTRSTRSSRPCSASTTSLVGTGAILPEFPDTVKQAFDFGGELYLGHLRYGTSGGYNSERPATRSSAAARGRRAT